MLTVYTTMVPKPPDSIDLSRVPLDELVDAALSVHAHQTSCTVWFGYLDGWMLTPREDILLRRVLRKFECFLVTSVPLALSQSWKNELRTVYTADPHYGAPGTHHDGGAVHDGCKA